MRAMLCLALLCGAMLVGGAFGDSECTDTALRKFQNNEVEFGMKLTGCLAEDAGEDCCDQVNELFAEDGELGSCLCDEEFFDTVLDTLSTGGYSADSILEMWGQCGVSSAGTDGCGDEEDGEVGEPKVKAQLLLKKKKKKLLLKKLVKKAVVAKALKAKALKAKALKAKPAVAKPAVAKPAAVATTAEAPAVKTKKAAPVVVVESTTKG